MARKLFKLKPMNTLLTNTCVYEPALEIKRNQACGIFRKTKTEIALGVLKHLTRDRNVKVRDIIHKARIKTRSKRQTAQREIYLLLYASFRLK